MSKKRVDYNLTFDYKGEQIHLIPQEKWLIGEARAASRWIGSPIEEMGQSDAMYCAIAISVKRVHPDFRLQDTDTEFDLGVIADLVEQAQVAQEEAEKSVPTEAAEVPVDEVA